MQEENDAALRHLLQIAAMSARGVGVIGGMAEGREAKFMRGRVATASVLNVSEDSNVGKVEEVIGSTLRSPHMNGDRIHGYFGWRHRVEDDGDPTWVIFFVDDANSV